MRKTKYLAPEVWNGVLLIYIHTSSSQSLSSCLSLFTSSRACLMWTSLSILAMDALMGYPSWLGTYAGVNICGCDGRVIDVQNDGCISLSLKLD